MGEVLHIVDNTTVNDQYARGMANIKRVTQTRRRHCRLELHLFQVVWFQSEPRAPFCPI